MESVSIVIRARNERERLGELLDAIDSQVYDGAVEVIVVDSESSDGTAELAKQRGALVVPIKQAEFSYPKSMNAGVAAATHELIILTVAHALPVSDSWIRCGVSHFKNAKVAGVYSNTMPRVGASFAEKIFYWPIYFAVRLAGSRRVKKRGMSVMGATNCIFRKTLWQQHHFDERYGAGGEDGEWAAWAMDNGYDLVRDYRFAVRHSHEQNFGELMRQIRYWQTLGKPQPFEYEKIDAIKKGRFDG